MQCNFHILYIYIHVVPTVPLELHNSVIAEFSMEFELGNARPECRIAEMVHQPIYHVLWAHTLH